MFDFEGKIYYIPNNTYALPNFSKLTPVGKIYTKYLNIENQSFNRGFPGVTDRFEYFAIDYMGKFYIKESAEYCFKLGSDDGSKLIIDDSLLINNDYQHALVYKSACRYLTKGIHKIEVQYFQGPREEVALKLTFKKKENIDFLVFDLTQLYPISINETDETIDVSIGNEILFESNSYTLNNTSKQALSEIKRILIDKEKYKSITINGFTDDVGSDDYNLTLSKKRAEAVKELFTNLGINPTKVVTQGLGEKNPKAENIDEVNRKMNRRVELTILKDTIKSKL